MTATAPDDLAISDRLDQLVARAGGDKVTLGWILDQLHERAFGLFLLILALPCCIPFLYGVPQIVALPLMFISVQILIGRRVPWLPHRLAARDVSAEAARVAAKERRRAKKAEGKEKKAAWLAAQQGA